MVYHQHFSVTLANVSLNSEETEKYKNKKIHKLKLLNRTKLILEEILLFIIDQSLPGKGKGNNLQLSHFQFLNLEFWDL